MNKKHPYRLILALMLALPTSSFAAGTQISGISDQQLLILLLSFIAILLMIIHALNRSIRSISKGGPFQNNSGQKNSMKSIALLLFLGSGLSANAAETTASAPFVMSNELFWSLITIIVLLVIIISTLFRSLKLLIKLQKGESFEETPDIIDSIGNSLTDNIPIAQEAEIMMDHEYDGIRELDNNLPPWWKYLFYGTIIFGVIYLIRFHITGDGQLSHAEYLAEVQEAEEAKAVAMANATESITEENVEYLVDLSSIQRGEAIFKGNCATCHGQLGEGGAGPNLTDEYWIHGGGIKNVFKTIKYGVPAKGMIAWQSQFNPSQMQQVASYVLSLQGTNPPNGIAPQGEIYIEEVEEAPADSAATDSAQVEPMEATALVE